MSIKKKISNNPFLQALVIWVICITTQLLIHTLKLNLQYDWEIMVTAVLLYVFINPLLGIFYQKKWLRYTGFSIAALALLTTTLYISTFFIGTNSTTHSQPHKMMLITILVFYLMLVLISGFYRMVIHNLNKY
jgi:hypothetical protein